MTYKPASVRGSVGCSPYFYAAYRPFIKGKVLELGCGRNRFRDDLLADKDVEWIGIDFDSSVNPTITLTLDKDTKLPFPDKVFDVVLFIHSLDHLDWAGATNILAECRRVLKDRGMVFFETGSRGNEEEGDQDGHWINFEGLWKIVKLLEQSFGAIRVNKVYNNRIIGFASPECFSGIVGSRVEDFPVYKEWIN